MKFRMVDRILSWEPKRRIRGVKTVSFEEYCLRSPLGYDERLPESLLMESLFQLGNWLVILSSEYTRMGLIVRTGEVTFLEPLRPGEHMVMETVVRSYRDDGVLLDGTARVDGRRIVEGRGCLAVPTPLEEYYRAEDLKVLFSEIHRPEEG
jgi:3-hydroxyacyl-[acyl-carrier-protein] dehydratase